jgi:hypothetical protein
MKTKTFQSLTVVISVGVLAFGCLNATRSLASVVFYGGDAPEGGKRLSSYSDTTTVMVYDDFALAQDSTITRLWGNFSTGGISFRGFGSGDEASYEIRSGIAAGSGGTLLASGTMTILRRRPGEALVLTPKCNWPGS